MVGCVTFCATFESFFLELAQSGYQGPEFSCPDHDSTSTGTIGTCLL